MKKQKENNVHIYEDEELATTLNTFNIGDEIPPELYEVVAGIFAFIKSLDEKIRRGKMINNREIGTIGEEIAAEFLEKNNYKIIEKTLDTKD